ncbi:transmembrane and coiled-coil domain-containing protein 6 isoform X4 [Eptesicus fuscus]|uniref:transmembrane and coiled-coil domain-containing protein 6 isoform X4 n=2 Tax=Eptesicus fuscus TaxID=29078 RepID=UPI002403AFAA|nr:transmembrane and coiled-coil domain-containing protein 6 isoform X4 [Eptesicus fuscus]
MRGGGAAAPPAGAGGSTAAGTEGAAAGQQEAAERRHPRGSRRGMCGLDPRGSRGPAVPVVSPAGDRGKGERRSSGQPSSRLAAPRDTADLHQELCLYTLGNLIVESEAGRKQLLPQGIVPALASCIQSPHLTVLEALGYALSQLLQAKEAPKKIIPSVLASPIPQHLLQLLQPGPKLNPGVAVEFAWCLHYIICSQVNNALLITHGAVSTLGLLLLHLAGTVQSSEDAGLELLVCPVLRCLSNLLTEEAVEAGGGQVQLRDERVVVSVFILLQFLLQKHPSLLPEGLWLLNNLTANSPSICTSLLSLDLIKPLLQLLPVSNVVSVLVLTVLCNVAEKGPAYCWHLWPGPLLSSLLDTLAFSDTEVVGQSLELLQLLFLYRPEAAQAFLQQSGLQALKRHEEEAQLQDRVHALQQTALHR